MKKHAIVFLVLSWILLCGTEVTACSRMKLYPVRFDSSAYVFIGKVTGYTNPVKSAVLDDMFWGLVVTVVDETYLPRISQKSYEVFLYGLESNCKLSSLSEDYLKNKYPIGTEIRIIALSTKFIPGSPDTEIVRLGINPLKDCHISLNPANIPEIYSTNKSSYDYQSLNHGRYERFRVRMEQAYPTQLSSSLTSSFLDRPDYEVQKDLFLLSSSNDENQKKETLARLSYFYPNINIYSRVVDRYISDAVLKDELLKSFPEKKILASRVLNKLYEIHRSFS